MDRLTDTTHEEIRSEFQNKYQTYHELVQLVKDSLCSSRKLLMYINRLYNLFVESEEGKKILTSSRSYDNYLELVYLMSFILDVELFR